MMSISNEALTAEEAEQALPDAKFVFDRPGAALVVIDPQNDFLSPDGAGWPVFGRSVTENNTVANLASLFEAAKSGDMTVAISPHYEYPADGQWRFGGPAEQLLSALHMFERSGPLTVDDLPGSGADFLEQLKQFILDGSTIIASPHKIFGPQNNDLALQLRKRGVSQIILAGNGREPLRGVPSASSSGGGLRGRSRWRCDGRATARRWRRVPCGSDELQLPRPRRLDDQTGSLASSRRRLTPRRAKGGAQHEPAFLHAGGSL